MWAALGHAVCKTGRMLRSGQIVRFALNACCPQSAGKFVRQNTLLAFESATGSDDSVRRARCRRVLVGKFVDGCIGGIVPSV